MKEFFTLASDVNGITLPKELMEAAATGTDLLKEYRDGKRAGIRFDATTFVQGQNKNHFRWPDDELEAWAASFKGQPFLKNHSRNQDDRGGTIVESRLIEEDGRKFIRQTIHAVKPWAVEGVLDGTVDRFSLGWDCEEEICTACDAAFGSCGHNPTHLGKIDKKTGKKVEVLFRKNLQGVETSAVTHPAVPGTQINEMLMKICESRQTAGAAGNTSKEDKMKDRVLSLLGLPADTGESDALVALETRLNSPPSLSEGLVTALGLDVKATEDQAIAKIYTLVPRETLEAAKREVAEVRAVEMVAQGKKDRKITPAMEVWANAFARRDPDGFKSCLQDMPVQGPDLNAEPPPINRDTPNNDEPGEIAQKLGVDPKVYAQVAASERRLAAAEGR